jgi:hypothetical protein
VAIAPDATAVVIGGPGYANSTGRTTELTRDGSNFTSGRMTSAGQPDEGDQYGCSVAHGPGTRIAVGACREASSGTPGDNSTPGAGAVFIID